MSGDRNSVGRFELIERIGSGGFGETWRARDQVLDVEVAVKMFRDPDPASRERYLQEARSLARLSGTTGIAQVRDLIEEEGRVYLIMDFVEGRDLSDLVRDEGTLSLQRVMGLLEPVVEGLEVLHARGVVHRDVSPDNIRVTPEGKGKLLDFGSVLSTSQNTHGTITVKPGYAPPEQYADPSQQGPWTDVYALAATIYQCLCGRVPTDSLQRTFSDDFVAPSKMGVALSAAAEEALMSALALDYRVRTQSVSELMEGLRATDAPRQPKQEPLPVTTPEPEEPSRPERRQPQPSTHPKPQEPQPKEPSMHDVRTPKGTATKESPDTSSWKRAGSLGRRLPLVAAGIVALLVIVLAAGRSMSGCSRRSVETSTSLANMNVTLDDVDALAYNSELKTVFLTNCIISDEALERLAQCDHITTVSISKCTGFSSLAPLADMEGLDTLYLSLLDDFDVDVMLPKKMPNLRTLLVTSVRFAGKTDGLARLSSLESLTLSPVEGISDLSFVSSLTELERLDISGIDASGAEELLARLPKLREVGVNYCNLSSFDWAASCPELTKIEAVGNAIDSLRPLSKLEELTSLVLASNKVSDVSALRGCTKITRLYLQDNQIEDIGALGELQQLRTLSLGNNRISDASPLGSCKQLRGLGLASNRLSSIDFCERLIELQELDISHNQVSDISKLVSCAKMQTLLAQDNRIASIEALGNDFVDLTVLNVSNNEVDSLEPLAACSKLKYLVVNDNRIASLDGLQDKPNLEVLLASNNLIADISALATSTGKLGNVDLGDNRISDISALSGILSKDTFGSRATLLLDHNDISSIDALPRNMKYRGLALQSNPLKSFGTLCNNDLNWYALYLPYVKDADYTTLGELPMVAATCFVGVPFDEQVRILRAMDIGTYDTQPRFLTEEEAAEEMRSLREGMNERVSGTSADHVADRQDVQIKDSDAANAGEGTLEENADA